MVRTKKKKTIIDFFENSQQTARPEDKELLLALELSKKEHILEQKKRLAELSTSIPRKKRLIQRHVEEEEDDEDDWFQTISSRPQPKKKQRVQVKKEATPEEPTIEIEDLSEWMNAVKKEDAQQQESLVIDDWDALLREEPEPVINLTEDSQPTFHCSICNQAFLSQTILDDHLIVCRHTEVISDDDDDNEKAERVEVEEEEEEDSDCSVIDLVDANNEYNFDQEEEEEDDEHTLINGDTQMEEDDGYLSPLEGFTNINENRNEYNMYFDQLQKKLPTKRKPRASTSSKAASNKKKRSYFKRRNFYKKKKK